MVFKLWPKQQEIVDKVLDGNRVCDKICLGFRSGKTTISIHLAHKLMKGGNKVVHISPNLEIARMIYNIMCNYDEDLFTNVKKLILSDREGGIVWFKSAESLLNFSEKYDILIIDEPDYMYFRTIDRLDLFYIDVLMNSDIWRILIGTPSGASAMKIIDGDEIRMSTCDVNPMFSKEYIENECKDAIDRLKRDFLIE